MLGVPSTLTLLAILAEYNHFAVLTAGVFPLICLLAFLITPLAPADDDPTEPPLPTMEAYVPAPILACINAVWGVIDAVKDALVGGVMRTVGPAIAPHMKTIAQGMQLSLGISAIMEVGVGFVEIHTLGAAIITLIITMIALPESFGWAIEPGTRFGDCYNDMSERFAAAQVKL